MRKRKRQNNNILYVVKDKEVNMFIYICIEYFQKYMQTLGNKVTLLWGLATGWLRGGRFLLCNFFKILNLLV